MNISDLLDLVDLGYSLADAQVLARRCSSPM